MEDPVVHLVERLHRLLDRVAAAALRRARRARLGGVDRLSLPQAGGPAPGEPVRHVASQRLDQLEGDRRAERAPGAQHGASSSTGRAANNVLLTGARGTGKSSLIKACLNELRRTRPAADRGRQGRPGGPARHRRSGRRAARALHRLLRRPQLRRGRARLQGAEVDARRLGRAVQRQRADLRHQQPPPPAARVHAREPHLPAHGRRRGASRRGGGREDLAVRALRAVGQLLSVHAGRIPGHRGAVAAPLRRR